MQTLIDKGHDPLGYRFLCLLAHYRSDINFSWDNLTSATTALNRLRESLHQWPTDGGTVSAQYREQFVTFINDDLNTSQAIALIWQLVKDADLSAADKRATILDFDQVLGLQLADWQPPKAEAVPDDIMQLVDARQQARAAKDWPAADAARDALAEKGYTVVDTADGPQVKKL